MQAFNYETPSSVAAAATAAARPMHMASGKGRSQRMPRQTT